MRKKAVFYVVAIALVVGLVAGALSAGLTLADPSPGAPEVIHYQGMLLDSGTGDPVADGDYEFEFSIYDVQTGGTALWSETQTLSVENGMFSALLGSGKPLSPSVFDGSPRYLGIKVGADPEMTPRQLLASVPYALQAENADTVDGMEGADLEESAEIDADIAAHASDPSAHHARYTDAEALAAVLAGDGSGSTLDADLLDGLDSSAFLSALSDYGRSGVATDLYEGTTALSDKYVNQSGDSMSGSTSDSVLSVTNSGTGTGVSGSASGSSGKGIYGLSSGSTGYGVYGSATNTGNVRNFGGYFIASGKTGRGVCGVATGEDGRAVYGEATGRDGFGVYGKALGLYAYAGYFEGDVHVEGNVSVTGDITEGATLLSDKYAAIMHTHSGEDITSGTVADERIADTLARDGEIVPTVLANDGSGSGLDADLLDGLDSSQFLSTVSDYGRSGVAADLYEGTTALTDKYVNESGDEMIGSSSGYMLSVENSGTGSGVKGQALDSGSVTNYGGWFRSKGQSGSGVFGHADGEFGNGGYFIAEGEQGRGVYGWAGGDSAFGVYGKALGLNAYAGYFEGDAHIEGDLSVTGGITEGTTALTDKYVNESGDSISGSSSGGLLSVTNSGSGYGVYGKAEGVNGRGVYGQATDTGASTNWGGYFSAAGKYGYGVYGWATGSSGYGVYGRASGGNGTGVYGWASSSGEDVVNYGGRFVADGDKGRGVYAKATGANAYAGYFEGDVYVTGDVGIGTTEPAERLDVDGTVKMTGLQLTTSPTAGYVLTSDDAGAASWQPPGEFTLPFDGSVSSSLPAFKVTNTGSGYGIYGKAIGSKAYAGYFEGGVHVTGTLSGADSIARDDEIMPTVLASDGSGSTLDADLLDGLDSSDLEDMYVNESGDSMTGSSSGGLLNVTNSGSGYGVYGYASETGTVTNYGGYFEAAGKLGRGVYGIATHQTAGADKDEANYGGYFESAGLYGRGVYGIGTGKYGDGVYGEATGTSGRGVVGRAAGGSAIAVYGEAHNTGDVENYGGYFTAAGDRGIGVYGKGSTGGWFEGSGAGDTGIYAMAGWSGYAAKFRGNVLIESWDTGDPIIELGEGLDYAEGFHVSHAEEIEPGSVLIIDPDNPGILTLSTTPYDTKVAGIVTGANGLGSGVRLGSNEFDYDVALAGRVYCNVDATETGVEAGDLLTTSATPGYAMKATDYERAQGAILGKAMESLEKGEQGQILVLVTLQ